MATKYKVLGQSAPAATTAATLYTVPSSTYAVVSTITVANRSTGSVAYRIAVRPDGATLANQHYIAYDASVLPNDTVALTLGITLDAADLIEVYASTADLSFNAFGSEIDE
jgi:hypothetical protein